LSKSSAFATLWLGGHLLAIAAAAAAVAVAAAAATGIVWGQWLELNLIHCVLLLQHLSETVAVLTHS
jgi:hypothetical protein